MWFQLTSKRPPIPYLCLVLQVACLVSSFMVDPSTIRYCDSKHQSVDNRSHNNAMITTNYGFLKTHAVFHSEPIRSTSLFVHHAYSDNTSTKLNPKANVHVEDLLVIDDNIREITASLLDDQSETYWSKQLTDEQMESAKYVIQAWSQVTSSPSATKLGAEYIDGIIKRLESEKKSGNHDIYLTMGMYNLLIDIWTKAGSTQKAESLLTRMQSMRDLFPESIKLTNIPYNNVIHSWKRHNEGGKAEGVLKMMINAQVEPDEISYNGAVMAYARNYGKKGYAENAERLLKECISMKDTNIKIDVFLFNAVMDSYAKSESSQSANNAEQLLDELERYSKDHDIQPNTISYTTVIDAYAKQRSPDSAINAERVFKKMEAAFKAGNTDARPNNRSFNTVINAYVQSNTPGNALKAEQILMKMLALSEKGYAEAKPNVITFTTVINGWAKSGELGSGERAQKIFQLALEEQNKGNADVVPNSFMYSALIDAWIKSKDKGYVDKAYDIYSELYSNFVEGNGSVKPSRFLANQVIDAVSKSGMSGAGEKAETILDMLDNLYNKFSDDEMKANAQTYTMAMNAYAKSRNFGKAKRAQKLLIKMEDAFKLGNQDVKPNVFAYTAVLNACAFTVGDLLETKEALQIASNTYKKLCMSGYDKPNSITFATFLRVVINLIPKGASQQSAIISIFNKCCEHQQVNDLILDILVNSVTREQLETVIGYEVGADRITIDQIPSKWKSNAKVSKRDRRRKS